jgi:TonB family protein
MNHASSRPGRPSGDHPVSPDPGIPHIRPDHPEDVVFLLDRRRGRLAGSIGISTVGQVLAVLLGVFIINRLPPPVTSTILQEPRQDYDIVWVPQEGPGGGGGGGGNKMPDPPRKIELPGKDRISVPVAKPPDLVTPPKENTPEPPPIEQLTIPALAMAQGMQPLPGAMDGVPAALTDSQGSGSGGGAGTGRGTGIGPGEGSGLGPGSGGGTGGGVYRPGSGVSNPTLLREVKPAYTSEAMRAKIQGQVMVEAIVLPDGTVGSVQVVRSLDSVFGLDQEAVKAVRQWRFAPGKRLGQPVAVQVLIEVAFTLR